MNGIWDKYWYKTPNAFLKISILFTAAGFRTKRRVILVLELLIYVEEQIDF
jgi:hypothetical protein